MYKTQNIKHIHFVTDDCLYDRKAFWKVKMFLLTLYKQWRIYLLLATYQTVSPIFIST